jgi:hypothetical protein
MARRFTHREAESLIPQVDRLLRSALELKSEFDDAEREMRDFTEHVMLMGGVVVDREKFAQSKSRRESAGGRLRAIVEEVQEIGCLIKDLDIGLIDFPTLFRGTEVYLCWKLGEPAIHFWHGVEEGFRGRKPIDQDFLDHHTGDPAN